jgi:hypothetical protein
MSSTSSVSHRGEPATSGESSSRSRKTDANRAAMLRGETMHCMRILGYFLRREKNNCPHERQLQPNVTEGEISARIHLVKSHANT